MRSYTLVNFKRAFHFTQKTVNLLKRRGIVELQQNGFIGHSLCHHKIVVIRQPNLLQHFLPESLKFGSPEKTPSPKIQQEPIKETAKNPMIEPIIEGGDIATSSGKPVSMKTESYTNSPLKRYSVVVGSFSNRDNADNFTDKLKGLGYEIIVVQNEQGLYRVITHTTNSIDNAVQQVKKIRTKYADSWILVLKQ